MDEQVPKTVPEMQPVVSVIITCYNHADYLANAIQSVQRQRYPHIDIVVIDDGSTDNTRQIAASFSGVHYVHQANAGLSAARNKGIDESTGSYLVFLDADDWLYPEAVATNLSYLAQHPACAFVSGWHDKVDEWGYLLEDEAQQKIGDKHYQQLLKGNYIGMHAAVMYQRWVFQTFRFDTTLKACEDYDLYFRIARRYPVISHDEKIAAYRIHGKNMSANIALMLQHVLAVCRRQKPLLKDREEKAAYHAGLKIWRKYYAHRLFSRLWEEIGTAGWPPNAALAILAREKPRKFLTYMLKRLGVSGRAVLKKALPDAVLKFLHRRGYYHKYTPAPGKVNAGDFNRSTPFSHDFGFDRGGAIDRFYIEDFLSASSARIRGTVLEIGDNEYTLKYGRQSVKQSDILHIDSSNAKATFVGDISHVPQIPSGYFDCIIFTQTLHLIYDFRSALQTCYRILKPGGCLLLTVPGISHIDRGAWKDYWLWSFTDTAMKRLMQETFNGSTVDIQTYGNVYTAAAFLYGMGLPEMKKDALRHHDPAYQVIISVRAVKA